MDGLTLPSSPTQALQAEHERLLGRLEDAKGIPVSGLERPPLEKLSPETQALIHEARAYIERAKAESDWISDGRDRSQLRANLRFWASYLVNCTGAYPDTSLRPARPYLAEYSGFPSTSPVFYGDEEVNGETAPVTNGAVTLDLDELDQEAGEAEADDASEDETEMMHARPTWFSRVSRFFGLIAILIVGVVPLAAVCLALSLFYNMDNQSPWFAGNAATQTAVVAQQFPTPTPLLIQTPEVGPTPGTAPVDPLATTSLLFADVTSGQTSPEGSGCTPVLELSLDGPQTAGGVPVPAANIMVYLAGSDLAVASAALQSGSEPQSLRLDTPDGAQSVQGWLVQADHPWLDMEGVILPGSLFENCAQNQVSIVYRAQPGAEIWQQVAQNTATDDLDLSWRLLTWGPEPLETKSWLAAVSLQAEGGDGNYVYSAGGDLATTSTGSLPGGILPADQAVLEQAFCISALAQVGVTSGGGSLSRALALKLVLPECR